MRLLPLFVHNLKGNILIWWARMKSQNHVIVTLRGLDEVLRRFGGIDQIGIEYLRWMSVWCGEERVRTLN